MSRVYACRICIFLLLTCAYTTQTAQAVANTYCTKCPPGLLTEEPGANDADMCIIPPETIPVWDESIRIPVWVYLEMPLSSVTEEVKWTLRKGIAKTCDVTVDRVRIIAVTVLSLLRRRLLAGETLQADFEVAALNEVDESEIRTKLNTQSVSAQVETIDPTIPVEDVLLLPALRCKTGWLQEGIECTMCADGYYMTGTNTTAKCNECPVGSTSVRGSTSLSDCFSDCPANEYWDWPLQRCLTCPSFSTSDVGQTGLLSCKCMAGHVFSNNNCDTCAANFVRASKVSGECIPCPENSVSAVGSTNRATDCICKRNYYYDDTVAVEDYRCKPCERGFVKGPSNDAECTQGNAVSLSTLDGVELQLNGVLAIVFVGVVVLFVFAMIRVFVCCTSQQTKKTRNSSYNFWLFCWECATDEREDVL